MHIMGWIAAALIAAAGAVMAQTTDRVVFFELGSAELDATALQTIEAAAQDFADTGAMSVSIVGHTDTTGSAEYNLALSRRRADAVARALATRGVPEDEIVTAWRGQEELAVQTADNVAEPLNRRTEISFAEPAPVVGDLSPQPQVSPARPFFVGLGPYLGFNLEEGDSGSIAVGGNLFGSYFVTPHIAASGEAALFWNFDTPDNGVGYRVAAGADYHFNAYGQGDRFLPYVGANFGYVSFDGASTGGIFGGPEIGVTLGPVDVALAYDIVESRDLSEGIISLTVGYGLRF